MKHPNIDIRLIQQNKKDFLPLLLLADEQEDMIDLYLERGDLYALYDGGALCTTCVVTHEGEDVYEVKSLATDPRCQRRGYGRLMLAHIRALYKGRARALLVGTGETPRILGFYQSCGFRLSHRIPGFFTDHYDHPIVEDGVRLTDMIYLRMDFDGIED
jgi:GNAT superfamily N-acetyltransferase